MPEELVREICCTLVRNGVPRAKEIKLLRRGSASNTVTRGVRLGGRRGVFSEFDSDFINLFVALHKLS